jgi:hypothetical protein
MEFFLAWCPRADCACADDHAIAKAIFDTMRTLSAKVGAIDWTKGQWNQDGRAQGDETRLPRWLRGQALCFGA